MPDVIGAEPVILYGLDSNGVPVPLKLGTDGTLSIDSSSGLQLGSTPSTQAMGDAAAGGSATTASKNDHKHGMPAFGATAAAVGTSTGGAATTPSRSDHAHAVSDQTITERMILHAAQTADVTTSQTTTSVSYADLATTGPAVTVSPGVTQPHLILISARKSNSGNGSNDFASVAIAGAAAADVDADETSGATGHEYSAVKAILATAQASGATHTMKYKVSGNTGTFLNRRIIGIPM